MQLEIRGLENLSFRERQVVSLKETGCSNEEVALRLGISPSTVATLYHRARTKGYQVVAVFTGDPLGILEDFGGGKSGGDPGTGIVSGDDAGKQ